MTERDWDSATQAEKLLALFLTRRPWWLRLPMRVAIYLPGRLGWFYDRMEEASDDRALAEYRRKKAVRGGFR